VAAAAPRGVDSQVSASGTPRGYSVGASSGVWVDYSQVAGENGRAGRRDRPGTGGGGATWATGAAFRRTTPVPPRLYDGDDFLR